MRCILCEKLIKDYNKEFNQLKLSDSKTVDICLDCIHKIIEWKRKTLTKLFPTKLAKKWSKKDKNC